MKKLHINCLQCNNELYEDWDKILEYRGIRPAQEFGISTIRFYSLPIIFCNKCHSVCGVKLMEVTTEMETKTEEIAVLQHYRGK